MKTIRPINLVLMIAAVLWPNAANAGPVSPDGADASGATARNVDNDENARAQAMYRQAQDIFKEHRYEESRKLLLQLWSFRQTADVASALAKTELRLQLYRDAATHLQFCLDHFGPATSKKVLEVIKEMMSEAQAHVGTLHIKTNHDGAEVQVDGHPVGTSPLKSPVYVEPGQHEVTVSQSGDKETEPIEVAMGKDLNVDIALEHKASPTVAPGPPATSAIVPANATSPISPVPAPYHQDTSSARSIVPVIIGGAVFAVGLGTGIGFRLASNSKYDDAKALRDRVGHSGCFLGSASVSDCASLRDAGQSGDRDRNWSTVGFAAAGTALVATSIYWLWSRPGQTGDSQLRLGGSVSSQYSSVSILGEF